MENAFKPHHKDLYDTLMKYAESLNIPLGTNFLNARNHVESVKEEDDKILSLGMPMHPKEKEIEEKEERWRKNGVATHLLLPTRVTHKFP